MMNFKEKLQKVKAFVFDVDGVFSNSSVYLHPNGELMRTMNIKDGYAIHYALRKGYTIGIITGGNTESVKIRFENLGVSNIYMKSSNKKLDFEDFCDLHQLTPMDILYMGDDLPDYEVMMLAGFPTCPADAVEEIKTISKYISDKNGGEGCVRDIVEQVLRLQGNWLDGDAFNW